jgi:hypothetical protein
VVEQLELAQTHRALLETTPCFLQSQVLVEDAEQDSAALVALVVLVVAQAITLLAVLEQLIKVLLELVPLTPQVAVAVLVRLEILTVVAGVEMVCLQT